MTYLVTYNEKNNVRNKEDNRDGTDDNRSWNCGFEGPTDDHDIQALRLRQRKNLMTTLLLAQGIPLLLGGDELGRTQDGNNNAYCQDNTLSWVNWSDVAADRDLTEFVGKLTRLRRDHPIFRRRRYAEGRPVRGSGNVPDLAYLSQSGDRIEPRALTEGDDPFGIFLNGRIIYDANGYPITDNSFILYFNAVRSGQDVRLPDVMYGGSWELVIYTDNELIAEPGLTYDPGSTITMASKSTLVLRSLS